MTAPRDWDKEMAEIDKMIAADKTPPAAAPPAGVPTRAAGAAPVAPPARAALPSVRTTRPRDTLGVWLQAILGAIGAGALLVWPYGTACGTPLFAYLGGSIAVVGAGVWTMLSSWTHRRGLAHIVGVLILLVGIALVATVVLPRTGYLSVTQSWTCS